MGGLLSLRGSSVHTSESPFPLCPNVQLTCLPTCLSSGSRLVTLLPVDRLKSGGGLMAPCPIAFKEWGSNPPNHHSNPPSTNPTHQSNPPIQPAKSTHQLTSFGMIQGLQVPDLGSKPRIQPTGYSCLIWLKEMYQNGTLLNGVKD